MASRLLLTISLLHLILTSHAKIPKYPKQVNQTRDQAPSAPLRIVGVDGLSFGRTTNMPQEGFHINFGEPITCQRNSSGEGSTPYCEYVEKCDKQLTNITRTQITIDPYNPGTYTCEMPNGTRRPVFVMPLLAVDVKRFFRISLDFLKLPDNFPNHYYIEYENQAAVSVHDGVPFISGIFDEALANNVVTYRIDFQAGTETKSMIKFRLMTKQDSDSCCTEVTSILKFVPAGNDMTLYQKVESLRCISHLLDISRTNFHSVKFKYQRNSTQVKMVIPDVIRRPCGNLTEKSKSLPEECPTFNITRISWGTPTTTCKLNTAAVLKDSKPISVTTRKVISMTTPEPVIATNTTSAHATQSVPLTPRTPAMMITEDTSPAHDDPTKAQASSTTISPTSGPVMSSVSSTPRTSTVLTTMKISQAHDGPAEDRMLSTATSIISTFFSTLLTTQSPPSLHDALTLGVPPHLLNVDTTKSSPAVTDVFATSTDDTRAKAGSSETRLASTFTTTSLLSDPTEFTAPANGDQSSESSSQTDSVPESFDLGNHSNHKSNGSEQRLKYLLAGAALMAVTIFVAILLLFIPYYSFAGPTRSPQRY